MRTAILTVFLALLLASPAPAAPRVNNGGGVWVCESRGEIQWIQAADFFELATADRTRADFGSATTAEIFARQQDLLAERIPELQKILQKSPVDFAAITRYVPFPLSAADDKNFSSRPQPGDCLGGAVRYEQLAVYLYDDTLLIADHLWRNPRLQPIDQAAILFHEWVYKALRQEQDEQTSARTRRIVAHLFSGRPAEDVRKAIARELLFSSHDQLADELATFPVAPRCEAIVDGIVAGTWQARANAFGEKASFRGSGFRFEMETSARDGVPQSLKATDEATGWAFHLEPAAARATYLRLKRAELRFQSGGPKPVDVLFWCWNQS